MAFLAVLREGLETAVFLLAAFNASGSPIAAGFRGDPPGSSSRSASATRHLSRWRTAGPCPVLRNRLVLVPRGGGSRRDGASHCPRSRLDRRRTGTTHRPVGIPSPRARSGSVADRALGMQPRPTVIEALGWLFYLVPMALYVACPEVRPSRPVVARTSVAGRRTDDRRGFDASRQALGRLGRFAAPIALVGLLAPRLPIRHATTAPSAGGAASAVPPRPVPVRQSSGVAITSAGCAPDTALHPGRTGHVQGRQQRRGCGVRARAREGRQDPRRGGKSRAGPVRQLQPRSRGR